MNENWTIDGGAYEFYKPCFFPETYVEYRGNMIECPICGHFLFQ